jgi:hypothetical protein
MPSSTRPIWPDVAVETEPVPFVADERVLEQETRQARSGAPRIVVGWFVAEAL